MSKPETYLFFDGDCAQAMRFYERVLGGKIEMMMKYGESPGAQKAGPGSADKIIHARLALDGVALLASDWEAPGMPYPGMNGFSVSLTYPTADEARRVYAALADGGEARMPIEKTFWTEAFGMLVDRFGTPWMVGCDH